MLLGLLYTIRIFIKIFEAFFQKIQDFFVNMVVFNFAIRYMLENLLNFIVPFFKEITLYSKTKI